MAHLKDLIVNGPVRATSKVYSPEFVGDLTGTATKATQDADGNVIDETYLPLKGGKMSGNLEFSNSGTTTRGVIGTVGGNDYWRIVGGATADNDAYLEIATADDGSEPIYVRQYSKGKFETLARTATLLDGSGNTKFPGKVTASSFAGALTGNVTGNVSGSSGSCTGNSATATKLKTARTISLTGSVTGSGTFDGSGNLSIATTTNHTHNYLPLAGGTLTGTVNLANGTWNNIGDDASIGDCNQAGCMGVKGLNGATGLYFTPYSGSTAQKLSIDGSGTATLTGNLSVAGSLSEGGTALSSKYQAKGSYASSSHTHNYAGSSSAGGAATTALACTGNSATATKLKTARTISLTGSVTGSGSFDGSGNLSIATTTNHTHNYLPLSGGTVTGNVTFAEVTSTTYPAKSCGIYWNGSTDGASIYYRVDGNDSGRLVLNLTDDDNTYITFAKSGRDFATIDTSGNYSGNAATATKLKTARTISLTGSVTGSGSFDGSGNLSIATTTNHTHNYLPLAGGDMNGVLNTQNLIPNNAYRLVGNNTNPYYYGYFKNMCSNIFNITDSSNNSVSSISYNTSTDVMYYSANIISKPMDDIVGLSIVSGMYRNMRLYGQNIRLQSEKYISSNVAIAMASDEKVKSFTEDIDTDEEKLVKLFDIIKPKSYNYRYSKSDSLNIGFSAQEIEQAMIDLDIDTEKYGILNIQYGHMLSRGNDFEDGKYYTKFYEISYNDLFNLSLLKTHMMEKEHVERLAALEEKASKLDELEARLSALENK